MYDNVAVASGGFSWSRFTAKEDFLETVVLDLLLTACTGTGAFSFIIRESIARVLQSGRVSIRFFGGSVFSGRVIKLPKPKIFFCPSVSGNLRSW